MFSSLRPATPTRASLARTVLATLLVLVLLAGVAPFSSFSSSSHACQMECCAGKPPHEAGSCSVAFAKGSKSKAHAEHNEQAAHHSAQHQTHQPSSGEKSTETASIAPLTMTTPCSPACAAISLGSTQLRRQRETAALSSANRPRPPTAVIFNKDFYRVLLPSAERRRQVRPRAPPLSLINLSA